MVKKSDKKKKGLALCTDDQHLKPFGVRVNDLVRSPVGMVGCVLGVKYASATDAEAMQGGRLWVRYDNGLEAPVEWEPEHGYARCTISEHITRDIAVHLKEIAAAEEDRQRIEALNAQRAAGAEAPAGKGDKPTAKLPAKKAKK